MIDTLSALSLPWVVSQSHPLTSRDFSSELKARGVALDAPTLRALYRRGDLSPLLEVTTRRVRAATPVPEFPPARGGLQSEVRVALAAGRLRDPAADSYRPRLRFDDSRPPNSPGWWNGLVYSRWQLLAAHDLRQRLQLRRLVGPPDRRCVDLPPLPEWSRTRVAQLAAWVPLLMALEARYLPAINSEWLHLTNVEVQEWDTYRDSYDPVVMADTLQVDPEQVRTFAEHLLRRAHTIDPTGRWSELIRRAPERAWKTLTGDALAALDHRLAAEVLLLFYEDLVERHAAPPLPHLPRAFWHPLFERISDHAGEPLDRLLSQLGVSPHPGVVLVVEGESEELLVPRVFDQLDLRRTPDLVQVLCMRGANNDLSLVAAVTVAPLLGERRGDGYDVIRPPTRLVIAVDHDRGWETADDVDRQRQKIVNAIRKVIAAQGATVSDEDLAALVIVRQWPGRCFEFAHFDDAEIAAALTQVHPTCGGLDWTALLARVADVRHRGLDIKKVWNGLWIPEPSKVALADALWPTLRAKIDAARGAADEPLPVVAEVVRETYLLAQQSTVGTFVIHAPVPAPAPGPPQA